MTIDQKSHITIALAIALAGAVGTFFVVRSQVGDLRTEVPAIRTDLNAVKADVASTREDVAYLRGLFSRPTTRASTPISVAASEPNQSPAPAPMPAPASAPTQTQQIPAPAPEPEPPLTIPAEIPPLVPPGPTIKDFVAATVHPLLP